ncbi:MAG: hypothetical protein M3Y37_08690, partial [Chloroflexota bacterium]|nr:hypothetical protein [Chloroflexota bacterium]
MSPDSSSGPSQLIEAGLGESRLAQSVSPRGTLLTSEGLEFPHPRRGFFERWPWFWFVLPAFLMFAWIFIYPTARAFYLSLYDWPGY